jgi:PhoH-like ATPase
LMRNFQQKQSEMRKTYVVDTSALINNTSIWQDFPNSDIIIPIATINELDQLKKQSGSVGQNARVCIRLLDNISEKGNIAEGILLENNTLLKIDATYLDLTQPQYQGWGDPTYGDTQILACLYSHWLSNNDVCLISNDINFRVKAKSRSVSAISHQKDSHSVSDLYSGVQVINNEEAGSHLLQHNFLNPQDYDLDLFPHQCVIFQNNNGEEIALGRKSAHNNLKLIKKSYPWGISSRNTEQSLAIDLLMDKEIDLITLIGKAGSGKSIVALAAALELVISKKEYQKLIIYRPIESVGKDIGFLPGELNEKLAPWFSAIMDNFEVLFSNKHGADWKRDLEMFQKKGRIEFEHIGFIRGRSIPNSVLLIDESQNLSISETKTILTRAGIGTKLIFTADIEQIDSPALDATNNGITHIIEKFKNSEIAGHIILVKGERSRLATISSEIL